MEKTIISKSVVRMNEKDLESVAGGEPGPALLQFWKGIYYTLEPVRYWKPDGSDDGICWVGTSARYLVLTGLIALGYGLAKRNEIYNWLRSKFQSNKVETKK